MMNRYRAAFGNDHWPYDAGFGVYHVVTLDSDTYETFSLENLDELFMGDES